MILWRTHQTERQLKCGSCGAEIAKDAPYAEVVFDGDEKTRGRRLTRCKPCADSMARPPKEPVLKTTEDWWQR